MVSIIVAIANNNVIGIENRLPWHYKKDMQYFKNVTTGHTVLMGEKTFESILSYINKPLPNRTNVVASLQEFYYPNIEVTHDVKQYITSFPDEKELFIIGGKTIYDLTLDLVDRLYITHIDKDVEGDVFFSDIDYSNFKCIQDIKDGELRFCIYERVK